MPYVTDEQLFPIRREPRSIWERTGLTRAQRRRLDQALVALVVLLLAGWSYSVVEAFRRGGVPLVARRIGASPTPLATNAPPPAAFLVDAALRQFVSWDDVYRGESGALQVVLQQPGDTLALPDSLPGEAEVVFQPADGNGGATAAPAGPEGVPTGPGAWNVLLRVREAIRAVPNLRVLTMVPAGEVRGGRLGDYRLGSWPSAVSGVATPERYRPPRGFIRVMPEDMDIRVSEHFTLGEFLTKGQANVWPKYVVITPTVVDKAELTIQELERMGHPVERVGVVSAFRTPSYNRTGGDTSGRGALSRHMYGDAIDFFIDNNGDFRMDDLNGDGRVTVADARVMAEAAERVERKHPELIGGIGTYAPTGAHAGFIHVDTRGYRARW